MRGTGAKILDTRKTIPGLRLAQKYAVRVGGGVNHRIGLFDAVMLKENHVRAAGSLTAAIRAARAMHPQLPLIVEVETIAQLEEALREGCDRILIDDFDAATRREAVRIASNPPFDRRIPLEVSGGVDMQTLRAIAEDGVDCISIGGLTKHVRAIDLSLKLGPPPGLSATGLRSLLRSTAGRCRHQHEGGRSGRCDQRDRPASTARPDAGAAPDAAPQRPAPARPSPWPRGGSAACRRRSRRRPWLRRAARACR